MKKIPLLLIFFGIGQLFAQEEKKQSQSFSLEQAIEYAIKNNYNVVNAGLDIEAAKQKKWETTTMGLPQINGSVNYLNNMIFTMQGVSGNAFNPMGDPDSVATIAFGTKHSMTAGLTLSQLIFDGSYLVGLQSAKVYLKISENAKIKTNQEIKELTINSYGNVLLVDESIQIIEKNKLVLEKTLFETEQIYKNGLIEEESVEQLQITLTTLKSALANLKRQKIIAQDLLKLVLGIKLNEEIVLTEKLEDLTIKNVDLGILQTAFDVNNSIDYKIGQNLEDSKKLLLKLEKSRELPSLGAALNYGYNAFQNKFEFYSANQKWNNYFNLGVGLNIPVFSSFSNKAKKEQAKIALKQAQNQLSETEQKLKLQYEKAKSDYEFSIEEFATSKENLKLSERIEKKQLIKFKEGLSSNFDLNESQRQLYSAQQNYLQSMLSVIVKKAALEKVTNKN